jgi:peptidoglycan hydrolase-like protein with peptidoglycan-binding domain
VWFSIFWRLVVTSEVSLFVKRFLTLMLIASLSTLIVTQVEAASLSSVLKNGDKGDTVFQLQLTLYQLGFLTIMPSGTFDAQTTAAVREFQAAEGLAVDGAVGNQTWTRLQAIFSSSPKQYHTVQAGDTLWSLSRKYKVTVYMITQANNIMDTDVLKIGQKLIIPVPKSITTTPALTSAQKTDAQKARDIVDSLTPELLKWSEVDRLFPVKTVVRIIDVKTGRSFRVRRLYGHNHADVEPLTAEDTAILKELYNGKWSWERRPVVVEIAGRRIAGSINGYPHGGTTINDNGFPGHICVHFLDSRTHETNQVCPEHQAAIKIAAQWSPEVIVH